MRDARQPGSARLEFLDSAPQVQVQEAEYRRLLGHPPHHVADERVNDLAAAARAWYAQHGKPWVYLREAALLVTADSLQLDGVGFHSRQLHNHLRAMKAERAVLVVASAGRECEEQARRLWEEGKPDEYYFLEMFGSAVVERLVATMSGRICDLAENDGLMAVPHYSPGYTGWDVADQTKLFELITRGQSRPFPGPIEVLSSGMLRPKKSLLAIFGLTPRPAGGAAAPALIPCENCAFSPCQYRRLAYRHAGEAAKPVPAPAPASAGKYTVSERALRKWAQERVRIQRRDDGTIFAQFRFDGTTCSNMGRPLTFDYAVGLSAPADGLTILSADCRPAEGDDGHTAMCSYLKDGPALLAEIAAERPLLGRPLGEVLQWTRATASAGCYCSPASRTHKWGLALEAIHFTLTHAATLSPQLTSSLTTSP